MAGITSRTKYTSLDDTVEDKLGYFAQKMTVEAFPSERYYRRSSSVHFNENRPTIEELKTGLAKSEFQDLEFGKHVPFHDEAFKMGWMKGVLMPCLLNIWGVMLFLRLSWVVGQCGIFQAILVITLCNVVTFITSLSMSAVSTNGKIKGGGIYYMISRSLGAEFGGAIGVLLTIANSIAVATYLIGFVDSLLDMLKQYLNNFNGILDDIDTRVNDVRWIGASLLVFCLVLAIVGMNWVTRVQTILLIFLVLSQVDFIVGSFLPAEDEAKFGFVGYSAKTFSDNFMTTNYHDHDDPGNAPGFFQVFGVFFPAVTGIVAGANLSGDLKDPAEAIPKGTLSAIETSGDPAEYIAFLNGSESIDVFSYDNCTLRKCDYGSSNDQQTLAKISYTSYLVFAGCFAATLSSAIASLVGAPRVLQALAKDKLYPLIGFFANGYGKNNEPIRGYVLSFLIALGCVMIGNLDVVSSLLSNFFVAAYALINFSVFHASMVKSPGWRPAFKYYNQWVSLIGTFLCVAVMFLMDPITAFITIACVGILYFYIKYRKPEAHWGSSTEAQQFVNTLQNVHELSNAPDHVKNFRPKVLVFSGNPAHRIPLMDFANLLTKKLSLLMCADIQHDVTTKERESLKEVASNWLTEHKMKAFYFVAKDRTFEEGAMSCMSLAGLGKFSPNMILLGYKQNWFDDESGTCQYYNILHEALDMNLGLSILRLPSGCDFSNKFENEEVLDIEISNAEDDDGLCDDDDDDDDEKDTGMTLKIPKFLGNDLDDKRRRHRSKRRSIFTGQDGNLVPSAVLDDINIFKRKKQQGVIDIWWLYDDGGLTLLLPVILKTRKQFGECQLRVFALGSKVDDLDSETKNMAKLLKKFRICCADVIIIPPVTTDAKEDSLVRFEEICNRANTPINQLLENKERSNRFLRLAEILQERSEHSQLVVMTLPMPRPNFICSSLYMSWLEIMSCDMAMPFLFVRGNQTSVLTFYS
ncbi:solute carrier family 12 member 2-like [Tigriopus californicus]|uniref:solute carrier family 12 member 2-like n=1 Tax=Tigriopus californicus TaxID=6832 RepID=UPI0027DA3C62|nr:solute carrier family 12 member 2-like [Tigriopus californicus]